MSTPPAPTPVPKGAIVALRGPLPASRAEASSLVCELRPGTLVALFSPFIDNATDPTQLASLLVRRLLMICEAASERSVRIVVVPAAVDGLGVQLPLDDVVALAHRMHELGCRLGEPICVAALDASAPTVLLVGFDVISAVIRTAPSASGRIHELVERGLDALALRGETAVLGEEGAAACARAGHPAFQGGYSAVVFPSHGASFFFETPLRQSALYCTMLASDARSSDARGERAPPAKRRCQNGAPVLPRKV